MSEDEQPMVVRCVRCDWRGAAFAFCPDCGGTRFLRVSMASNGSAHGGLSFCFVPKLVDTEGPSSNEEPDE